MKIIQIVVLLFVFSINISYGQQTDIESKILKLLELTGAKQNFDVALDGMLKIQKDAYGEGVSNDFFDELAIEMRATSMDKLLPMIVPIYKRHLTEDLCFIIQQLTHIQFKFL